MTDFTAGSASEWVDYVGDLAQDHVEHVIHAYALEVDGQQYARMFAHAFTRFFTELLDMMRESDPVKADRFERAYLAEYEATT